MSRCGATRSNACRAACRSTPWTETSSSVPRLRGFSSVEASRATHRRTPRTAAARSAPGSRQLRRASFQAGGGHGALDTRRAGESSLLTRSAWRAVPRRDWPRCARHSARLGSARVRRAAPRASTLWMAAARWTSCLRSSARATLVAPRAVPRHGRPRYARYPARVLRAGDASHIALRPTVETAAASSAPSPLYGRCLPRRLR